MSTINVNYMTKTYNNFLKGQKTGKACNKSMANGMAEKMFGNEKAADVTETEKIGTVSTKDMTMEEYKQYIHDKISEIPLSPSRMQDTIAINISEAGFEAMKNDPEYEKWVLDGIRTDFSFNDPWASHFGGAYAVKNFGATKEEYHGTRWYRGCFGTNDEKEYSSRSKDSFWERKVENKKQLEKQNAKAQEKKRLQKKQADKAAYEEYLQHKAMMSQNLFANPKTSQVPTINFEAPEKAIASYEATFATLDGNGDII